MSATPDTPPNSSPFDTDGPLVYSLDRRGPNDPRFGSIHLVITLLTTILVAAVVVVL